MNRLLLFKIEYRLLLTMEYLLLILLMKHCMIWQYIYIHILYSAVANEPYYADIDTLPFDVMTKITPYKSNTDERNPVVTASCTFIMQTYTYPHLSYNYDNNNDQQVTMYRNRKRKIEEQIITFVNTYKETLYNLSLSSILSEAGREYYSYRTKYLSSDSIPIWSKNNNWT